MRKNVVERFSSIHQLLDVAMRRSPNKVFSGRGKLSSESNGYKFTKTESMDEALELLRDGYTEPLDKIKKEMQKAQVVANTSVPKVRPTTGVVGYAPCVPNAILGLPNSMISSYKQPMKSKIVTIFYSMSVSADTSPNTLIKSGVAVLQIINELELQGYRVKLDVELMGSVEDKEFASATVNVKDWKEHLDLRKISFPLVHPSAFRRIGFKWLETVPGLTDKGFAWGYGSTPSSFSSKKIDELYRGAKIFDSNTYYLNAYICRQCEYDVQTIMEKSGITKGVKAS